MQHGKVAGNQRGAAEVLRRADGGGYRAVNAVQPAVRKHAQTLVLPGHERVDGAHAHGSGGEQARSGGREFQHATHVGTLEGIRVGGRADRGYARASGGVGLAPARKQRSLRGRRLFLFRLALGHGPREIDGHHAHEQRRRRVRIARLVRVDHHLMGPRPRATCGPLGCLLGNRVSAETDDDLRIQQVIRHGATCIQNAIVVRDNHWIIETAQAGERVGKHRQRMGAREAQHVARLGRRRARAFARQQHRTARQKLGQPSTRRSVERTRRTRRAGNLARQR